VHQIKKILINKEAFISHKLTAWQRELKNMVSEEKIAIPENNNSFYKKSTKAAMSSK
jgi:hypothetical protein